MRLTCLYVLFKIKDLSLRSLGEMARWPSRLGCRSCRRLSNRASVKLWLLTTIA